MAAETLENAPFSGIAELIRAYLSRRRATDRPRRVAIAVPAPVTADEIELAPAGWSISCARLKTELGLRVLNVVNDFEAVCWGLPDFGPESRVEIGEGSPARERALGVLRPDRELGVGGLVPHTDGWVCIEGAGGKVLLAAADDPQGAVIEQIRNEQGDCRAEDVLSLRGLVNLYRVLSQLSGRGAAKVVPLDVVSLARRGEPLATKALAMYFAFLATAAASLALTIGARGGIYMTGGIVPAVLPQLQKSSFRRQFLGSGDAAVQLEQVPTYALTESAPALRGLRRILGFD